MGCGSPKIKTRIGQFAPFVAHRVCEYPICHITVNQGASFPTLYTNSVTCELCSFTFSQIRFDSDEMSRLYGDYRTSKYATLRAIFEPGYAAIHPLVIDGELEKRNRQRAITGFLKESIELNSIKYMLDYGGDRGQHIPAMFCNSEKYVYDVSNPQPIDGVTMVHDIDEVGAMDFVMSCNVLEHLPYPGDALNEMKKFL